MELLYAIKELLEYIIERMLFFLPVFYILDLAYKRTCEMYRERELFSAWLKKFAATFLLCAIIAIPGGYSDVKSTLVTFGRIFFMLFLCWKYVDEYIIGGITSGKDRSLNRLKEKLEEAEEMEYKARWAKGKDEKKAYQDIEQHLMEEYHKMLRVHERKYGKMTEAE